MNHNEWHSVLDDLPPQHSSIEGLSVVCVWYVPDDRDGALQYHVGTIWFKNGYGEATHWMILDPP